MKKCIGAQGEITIFQIEKLPDGLSPSTEGKTAKGAIISHSESGHHHILTGGADVLERVMSNGMKALYAIFDEPQALIQDAAVPHEPHALPPGIYEFRIAREYDPFSEQARRVAD